LSALNARNGQQVSDTHSPTAAQLGSPSVLGSEA